MLLLAARPELALPARVGDRAAEAGAAAITKL